MTKTPATAWVVQAVTPRVTALYNAASVLRGIMFDLRDADLKRETLAIAADLDAQADALTRQQHAAEVAKAKGEG